MSTKIEEIKNSTQKPVKYKIKCVAHHVSNGLLNTLSFLKVSNSEGYHAAFSYSPIISARKRIFQNILARDPFEPSNIICVFKITVSSGGFR